MLNINIDYSYTHQSSPGYTQLQDTRYGGSYTTQESSTGYAQNYSSDYGNRQSSTGYTQQHYPDSRGYQQSSTYTQQNYPGNYASYRQRNNDSQRADQSYQMNQWMYATQDQDITWTEKSQRQG